MVRAGPADGCARVSPYGRWCAGDARAVLLTLIEENLLTPGPKKLYVSYYRKRVYADLLVDGSIRFKDVVYTSPVPCALQMKRSLNPSLKTDAGWSSMFSAASGESLKDIKDRLNIRKRGPNSRTTLKEKKVVVPGVSPTAKERLVNAAVEISRLAVVQPKCPVCRKEATTEVASCSACQGKTHQKCAQPPLDAAPSTPWFCDKCLTSQADGILEFLQQTRRILVEKIEAEKPAKEDVDMVEVAAATPAPEEGGEETTAVETDAVAIAVSEVQSPPSESPATKDKEPAESVKDEQDSTETTTAAENTKAGEAPKTTAEVSEDAENEKTETQVAVVARERTTLLTPEEKFLALVDSLIEEVSSRKDRMHIIANSTGATLVHLAKTLLVQLVENGNREILEATKEEKDEDEEESAAGSTSRTSEVDALVKIFDLRHQILSSQAQFEQTTSTLSNRTEKRLRVAEAELMDLEESRAAEARAVSTIVETIDKYDQDLQKCKQKIQLNKVILESITHRRNFIRSTNVNNLFVPSYRLTTKQMTGSSDQLLYTVLLDKLRGIAKSINEWAKMEGHFDKMTSSLRETLTMIGTKRSRDAAGLSKLPSTPALFSRVKIPPSRRLIERQIANYEVNLDAIRVSRAETRKTLAGVLKIAREEHLSSEIIDLTDHLYQKCRPGKGEEEEEKPEDEDAEEIEEDVDHDVAEDRSEENEEPDLKKQRVEQPDGDSQTSSEQNKVETEPEAVVTSSVIEPVVEVAAPESTPAPATESEPKAELESSADEIPLSEASATLADLTPDESVDTVSKSPGHHSILNIETTEQKSKPKVQSETSSLLSASSAPEPVLTAAEPFHQETVKVVPSNVETLGRDTSAQSKFSNFGEERQYSRSSEPQASLGHLLDLQQHEPQPQLSAPQAHADSIFHSDFQQGNTEMSHPSYPVQQMQQEVPKASSFQHQMLQQQLEQSQALPTFIQQPSVAPAQRKPMKQPKERQVEKLGVPSMQLQQQQHRAELEKRQQDEEHQNFLNQTLEVLKQQQVPRKNVVVVQQPPPKQPPQQKQPAQPKQPKQPKQQKQKLPPPQQQIQAQLQQAQQFQRMPHAQAHPISRGKDLSLHTHSPSQPVQAAPQFASQLQQPLHHSTNASHLQMPTHQQLTQQQHQAPLHLQTQQQTLQHAQQQQQHVSQTQRQIQHPLYGDVQKGISMSALGGAQDLFADHTQQSHMGMELQQHQLHQSHLSSAADVMRPHHQHPHDLVGGGHGSVGSGLNSHFGAANASSIPSSNTLRSTPFLTADARGTQQRSYFADESQQQHGHQAMHSHDLYGSQLGGHHQQQQHHLYGSDLHQQHQQHQQQQQSRSILTDQDYQSHLLNRHYRSQQDMDPSGSDDVNMGPWN